jgi:translation initiation factor 2B subunit (eIF-2B alpha/beta/delta family)
MPAVDDRRDVGWSAVNQAARDSRSGALEIALRAAEALAALPGADLDDAVATLVRGHPSMAPLWRLASDVLGAADHRIAAAEFARRLLSERRAIADSGLRLLRFPTLVVQSYSSTIVSAVSRTGARILCARSEPGGEGAVTARLLREAGASAEVIEDQDAQDEAGAGTTVVTGADALGPGGIVNKVGTAALAGAARSGGGGCYALAGTSKMLSVDLPAPSPFERIPLDLLAAVITEEGPIEPVDAAAAAAGHELHPSLAPLLPRP